MASVVICSLLTAERGLYALAEVVPAFIAHQPKEMEGNYPHDRTDHQNNFYAHAGNAVFYGLCAANVVPGGSVIGVALFAIYSVSYHADKAAYFSGKLLGHSIFFIARVLYSTGEAIYALGSGIGKAVIDQGIATATAVGGAVAGVGGAVIDQCIATTTALSGAFTRITREAPAYHPAWVGVVAQVVAAIAIAKLTGRL